MGASVVNALSARLDVEVDREAKVHLISFRRGVPGTFDGRGPGGGVRQAVGAARGRAVRRLEDRHPGALLAGPPGLHRRRHDRPRRGPRARPADDVPGARADDRRARPARAGGAAGAHVRPPGRDRRVRRAPVHGRARVRRPAAGRGRHVHARPCRCSTSAATWSPPRSSASSSWTWRSGGATTTTPRSARSSTSSPRPRAARTWPASSARWSRPSTSTPAPPSCSPSEGADHQGGRPRGRHRGGHRPAGRTPVRGPDQGDPRHPRRHPDRRGGRRPGADGVADQPPRGDRQVVRAVAEKVANAMRARVAARTHRDVQRRKSALESSSMPAKLVDCRSGDIERTELFIVEGNSALGTAKLARDSEFQALLPIRGKILNVHKASLADMLKNAECAAIIQVLGAGSGPDLRPRGAALQQGHPDGRRGRRRCAHPLPAAHALPPLHAPDARRGPGLLGRPPAAPHRGAGRPAAGRPRSATRTPTPS